ncbi:hypothetical protein EGI31_02745 [Lacihabitans soyangensis]|uniref:Uncharacterized protein n=1 Tax=Lacihabitans soyangensis TaxID=869394 RepID=A0AAE3KR81_9BACT|nr:hypothetical protein [Lacihabitans soyangensis]
MRDIKKEIDAWRQKEWNHESIYKYSALGGVQQNLQQQSFSQNQFRGLGLAVFGSKVVDRTKYEMGVERYLSALPFYKSENGSANSYSGNMSLARHYLRKVNKNFAIGAQVSFNVSARFGPEYDNNSISSEVFLSLNPKIKYVREFRLLRKSYAIDYSLSASLASVGFWTPTFTSNFTNNKFDGFLPNSYNAVNSRLLLRFPNKKRITSISPMLGYGWNLQALTPSKYPSVINGTHTIYLIANLHKIK